jgi:predicted Zn-dependent protease with MMP-like domain
MRWWGSPAFIEEIATGDEFDPRIGRNQDLEGRAHPANRTPGCSDGPGPRYAAPVETDPLAEFETMVVAAVERLPEAFRARLGSVAIVVEDEPSPGELASVGARGLFGLYRGVPRTAYGADGSPSPSVITIYRGPHVRAYPDPAVRALAVEDTLRHEVAHHLGISDTRLRELRRGER